MFVHFKDNIGPENLLHVPFVPNYVPQQREINSQSKTPTPAEKSPNKKFDKQYLIPIDKKIYDLGYRESKRKRLW